MASVYLLGAGCSYGTLERHASTFPPLAKQFGTELTKRVRNWRSDYSELEKVACHLNKAMEDLSLEDLWTCIDYHAKFQGAFCIPWKPESVVQQLKRALVRIYGRQCDDTAKILELSEDYTLGRIVNSIKPGDTLISFNYDTLAERLARRKDLALWHSLRMPPGAVRFAKPHGSASWNLRDLDCDLMCGPPKEESIDEATVDMQHTDPLLLGAVPLKSELIREVQHYYTAPLVFDVILHQWRVVAEAIHDAERVVVLGYSFPREDTYGRFFFREAMRQRTKRLDVDYYEIEDRKSETGKAIIEAFPGDVCLKHMGKVEPAP